MGAGLACLGMTLLRWCRQGGGHLSMLHSALMTAMFLAYMHHKQLAIFAADLDSVCSYPCARRPPGHGCLRW